jgi:hypothetical protein
MEKTIANLRLRALAGLMILGSAGGPAGADERTPPVHRIALPGPRPAATGRDWSHLDAVAGDPPSAQHPRGTVIVAEAIDVEPSPSITERDLAGGDLVRSVPLPLSSAFSDLRIVRAGDALHLLAAEGRGGRIVYVRLGEHLEIERLETIGRGEPPRVATDGALVAVLWAGARAPPWADVGWQLLTLDGAGERLGESRLARTGESTFLFGDPLAVAAGRVVALVPRGAALDVVELGPDARPRRTLAVPWSPDDARLFATGDRVYFTDDCRYLEVSGPELDDTPPPALASPPLSLPGRPVGARSCVAFEAAADDSGSLVTTEGDVRDAALRAVRHFATPEGIVMRALWIYGSPALLVAGGPGGRASLLWATE